jgi:hypothetical protein
VVNVALEAIAARDWERLRPHLHPYLHRHRTDGQRLRGRSNVIGMLEANGPQKAPASYELRDGQIYRWRAG